MKSKGRSRESQIAREGGAESIGSWENKTAELPEDDEPGTLGRFFPGV